MNAASLYLFVSLGSLPYQGPQRFDTEEVAGSNPVAPTTFINKLRQVFKLSPTRSGNTKEQHAQNSVIFQV